VSLLVSGAVAAALALVAVMFIVLTGQIAPHGDCWLPRVKGRRWPQSRHGPTSWTTDAATALVRNMPPSIPVVALQQIRLVDAVLRAVRRVIPNADARAADSDLVEPRLQPPVRFQKQLILIQVSLMPFRVRVHGGHLVGKSLRHIRAVEDADADPADDGRTYCGGLVH
jgi:hypothetical protein